MNSHKYKKGDIVKALIDNKPIIGIIDELVPFSADYLLKEEKHVCRTYISEYEIQGILDKAREDVLNISIPKNTEYTCSEYEHNGERYVIQVQRITGKSI